MIIFLIYIVIGIAFTKKNKMFLLLPVFALLQGAGSFIDQEFKFGGKNIFSRYEGPFQETLLIIILIISLFYYKKNYNNIDFNGSNVIKIYFVTLFIMFILSLYYHEDPSEVLITGRNFLYIPLGYFLWKIIYSSITRENYEKFLNIMFLITFVSSVLYVLNSSGIIKIFNEKFLYEEIQFQNNHFYRDFGTIPIWSSLCFNLGTILLLRSIKIVRKSLIYLNIMIYPFVVLLTFTRSILFTSALSVVLIFITLFVLKDNNKSNKKTRNILLFIIPITCVVFVLANSFESYVSYFDSRISSLLTMQNKEQNVDVRVAYLEGAIKLVSEHGNPLIGEGFTRKDYGAMDLIGAWSVDSTIPYHYFHTGVIGVLLLFSILIYFTIDAWNIFRRSGDYLIQYLFISFMVTTISALFMGGGTFTGSIVTFADLALYTMLRGNIIKTWNDVNCEENEGRQ